MTLVPKSTRYCAAGLAAVALSVSGSAVETGSIQAATGVVSPAAVDFRGQSASRDVREVAEWARAGDARRLPFVVVDKAAAKVFVFDRDGRLLGAAAALLGLGLGDDSVPGIGLRKLATITPVERTTPAGRFEASLGHDLEQDILWIDYDAALSLHRVITGNRKDRRVQRLASPSPLDNRISYGCINVPIAFYDAVVAPAFTATMGIVYILPQTKPMRDVFALPTVN